MQSKDNLKSIIIIVVMILLIAGLGVLVIYLDSHMGRRDDIEEQKSTTFHKSVSFYLFDEEEEPIYYTTDRVKFYLIAGTDHSGNEFGLEEEYQGGMADFLLLIGVNDTQKTFGYLEINRDTITKVPIMNEDGEALASAEEQICTAHAYGTDLNMSAQNTADAVSMFLKDTPIDGYFFMSMDDIDKVNHLVGGVTVTMDADYSDIDKAFQKGETITLTDEQAKMLVWSRMNVQDGTNENRMARQTLYMNAMLAKVGTLLQQDNQFLTTLFDGLDKFSTTDIGRQKMGKIGSKAVGYSPLGMMTMQGKSEINVSFIDNKEHAEFYVSDEEIINVLSKFCKLEKYEDEDEDVEDTDDIEETDDADEDMEE